MSSQYGELRPTSGVAVEIGSVVWGMPANFNGFRVLASLLQGVAQRKPPKLCTMFFRLLGWYAISYTFSGVLAL